MHIVELNTSLVTLLRGHPLEGERELIPSVKLPVRGVYYEVKVAQSLTISFLNEYYLSPMRRSSIQRETMPDSSKNHSHAL